MKLWKMPDDLPGGYLQSKEKPNLGTYDNLTDGNTHPMQSLMSNHSRTHRRVLQVAFQWQSN